LLRRLRCGLQKPHQYSKQDSVKKNIMHDVVTTDTAVSKQDSVKNIMHDVVTTDTAVSEAGENKS
jgi:hypothetical protein